MNLKIKNPNNLPTIDYRELKPLQGDLKKLSDENYAKLKAVLETRGFDIPFFIWESGKEKYLLDGHQRQKVLITENASDNGSYLVPYIVVEAKTRSEAVEKLLEITSQYGAITAGGLDELIIENKLDRINVLEKISFDALPTLSKITLDRDDDEPITPDSLETTKTCPSCGYEW